jgi:hypothetical protein
MTCYRAEIPRLLIALSFLLVGLAPGQDLVSALNGAAGTADSGYVALPPWMDDLDGIIPHVYWSRPAILADGTVLFVSALPNGTDYNPFSGQPASNATVLLDGADNQVRELASAAGFHVYVTGDQGAQSMWYKTALGTSPGFLVPAPAGVVAMRHLRAVAYSPAMACVVFTGVDGTGTTRVYSLWLVTGIGVLGNIEPIPGSDTGALFPDVAADGNTFVFRAGNCTIQCWTGSQLLQLGQGSQPAISADASTVCFVDGGLLRIADLTAGTLATVGDYAPGSVDSLDISDDGRFVVFASTAPLVAGLGTTELANAQIYLYDRLSQGIQCMSNAPDGNSVCPTVDGGGQHVAFASVATSLGAGGYYQVYLSDRGDDYATNHAPELTVPPALYCAANDARAGNSVEIPITASDAEGDSLELSLYTAPTAAQGEVTDRDGTTISGWFSADQLPLVFTPALGFAGPVDLSIQARDRAGQGASLATVPKPVEIQVGTALECLTGTVAATVDAPWSTFASGDRIGVSTEADWLLYAVQPPDNSAALRVLLQSAASGTSHTLEEYPREEVVPPQGALARDRRVGVYCSTSGLHWFSFDEEGTVGTTLDTAGNAASVSLADDGATVVFERSGAVCVWRPEDGARADVATLVAGSSPVLSGDGTALAYVDGSGDIQVLRGRDGDFDTTPAATVTDAAGSVGNLRLSVSGRFLLYETGATPTLKVVDLADAGSGPALTLAGADFGELASSGSFIYYVDGDDVAHWRSLLNGDDRVLCGNARRAVISPDGRFVVLVSKADIQGGRTGKWDIYRAPVPFAANHAPTATSPTYAIQEDLADSAGVPLEFQLGAADADAWDRDLTVTILEPPANGTAEIRYGWGTATIVYTPDANFHGTEIIIYRVTDATGQTATGTVTVNVAAVDDPPELAAIPDQALFDGPAFSSFDLDDYLTEVDGDGLTIDISGQNELTVAIDADRVVTITPPTSTWTGSETITITVTDQTAAQLSAQRSFTLSNWYRAQIVFAAGWNAVAFPIRPTTASVAAVLALTTDKIATWTGHTYEVVTTETIQAQSFVPGQGYWIYVPQDRATTLEVRGAFPTSTEFTFPANGWSFLGPVGLGDVCPVPPALSAGSIYHYVPASVRQVRLGADEPLQAGQAYWIRNGGAETTVSLPLEPSTAR